jgi:hypothetical protein
VPWRDYDYAPGQNQRKDGRLLREAPADLLGGTDDS